MALQVKAHAAKLDNLSSIPGTHMVGGKNKRPVSHPLTSTQVMHVGTPEHNDKQHTIVTCSLQQLFQEPLVILFSVASSPC